MRCRKVPRNPKVEISGCKTAGKAVRRGWSLLSIAFLSCPLWAGLAVDPLSCDFGKVAIVRAGAGELDGQAVRFFVEQPVRITNTGSTPVYIAAVRVEPPGDFSVRKDGCSGKTLAPGASCVLLVRFLPQTPGGKAAQLIVDTPEGISQVVVPLWGDGVDLLCNMSICEGPPVDFGSACPPATRTRTIGVRNDTEGDLLVSISLDSPDGSFTGIATPQRTLKPGEEISSAFTCRFEGEPGPRNAVSHWDMPPPMLPVIRRVDIPLTAWVRPCLQEISRNDIIVESGPGGQGFTLLGRKKVKKEAMAAWRTQDEIRLAVLGRLAGRKAVVLGRAAAEGNGGQFTWARIRGPGPVPEDPLGVLVLRRPIVASAPVPPEGQPWKASPLLHLFCGRKKGWIMSADGEIVEEPFEFASGRVLEGPIVRSALSRSRAYAVWRKQDADSRTLGLARARLRVKELAGEHVLRLKMRPIGPIAEIAGRKAVEIRAMDCTAFRKKDGTWGEMIALVARYAAQEDTAVYLVLRDAQGQVAGTFRPEDFCETSGRVADVLGLRLKYNPLMSPAVPVEKDDPPGGLVDLPSPRLYSIGYENGTVMQVLARRREQGVWTFEPASCEGLPHPLHCLVRRKGTFATQGRKGDIFAVGKRSISRLAVRKAGLQLLGRIAIEPPYELRGITSLRPKGPRTKASPRPKGGVYLLASLPDGTNPTVITLGGLDDSITAGGPHGEPPVLYAGELIFRAEVGPGENTAPVTLSAYAYDPEGEALSWSWTAPGIEFEDPTSPEPTGIFPLGETLVYVTVRDGPPDDETANETGPALVRVIVERRTGCPEDFFDVNGDGGLDIADAVFTLSYLFAGGEAPPDIRAADFNGDGDVDISDPIYLLLFLFAGGPAPVCPQ